MAVKFVKYSCGCIGFLPDENGKAYILDVCDKEYGDLFCFSERLMSRVNFDEVSEAVTRIMISKLQKQLYDGEKFKEIQMALLCPMNTADYHLKQAKVVSDDKEKI